MHTRKSRALILRFLPALALWAVGATSFTMQGDSAECQRLLQEIRSYQAQLTDAIKRNDQQLVAILQQAISAANAQYQQECLPLPPPPPLPRRDVHVLTQHNNNGRTGAYLAEIELTPSAVAGGHFGRLFDLRVDGQIYAQPLYAQRVATNQGVRNAVFVATQHNAEHF